MIDQNRILREITIVDSLFTDFPSLSNFDDTYTCDVCTDTHLCSVCVEIEAALHVDISYEISTDKVDVADLNVVPPAKILSSIKQPSILELKSLSVFLEFNGNFPVIISFKFAEQEQKLYKY